ncbi:YjbH domain-containing protein [candidate division KSB1 bacterium]|nr:YjbH domain-containing protein [candidate division KSB1 bacterium]
MRRLSIFMGGIFFFFFLAEYSIAEQQLDTDYNKTITSCQSYLIAAGIENIEIQIARNHTIWISYENRSYRNEVTALGIVLNYASECLLFADQFILVPKYRNTPLKYIEVTRQKFQQFIQNEISSEELLEALKISVRPIGELPLPGYGSLNRESSFFKLDLVFSPGFKTQFAQPDDPAKLQFNFLSDLTFTLAKGLQFNGQWVAPLYNEFQQKEGRSRLGRFYLNQLIRLPSSTFLSLSGGLFEYQCYGFSGQVQRFFWGDRLTFSTRLDYLETSLLSQHLPLNFPCRNQWAYLLQGQYRFDPINFTAKLTWGRYLLGDRGWRIDIVRTFRELELGFMGVWSESLEFLTGMTVRIPFPVSKQVHPGKIRVCSPAFVPWNYRYLPCFDGFVLDTGNNELEEKIQQLTKSFIRANIHQFKNSVRYVKLFKPDQIKKLFAQTEKSNH